jgi:hypothetical protein
MADLLATVRVCRQHHVVADGGEPVFIVYSRHLTAVDALRPAAGRHRIDREIWRSAGSIHRRVEDLSLRAGIVHAICQARVLGALVPLVYVFTQPPGNRGLGVAKIAAGPVHDAHSLPGLIFCGESELLRTPGAVDAKLLEHRLSRCGKRAAMMTCEQPLELRRRKIHKILDHMSGSSGAQLVGRFMTGNCDASKARSSRRLYA